MAVNLRDQEEQAKNRWEAAQQRLAQVDGERLQPGDGYGDGGMSQIAWEQGFRTASNEEQRLYREYQHIGRRRIDDEMLALQRSQKLATWASFAVAAAVGLATIVQTILALVK